MQLTARGALALALASVAWLASGPGAGAQVVDLDVGSTVFYESGGPLEMLVVTPHARAAVNASDEVTIRAAWEADVVSGASVAVVDAPGSEVDAITSATRLSDFRNVVSGGAEVRSEYATIRAGYAYGTENDYRSHGLTIGARAEAWERTAVFDLGYSHGWDSVCDVNQPRNAEAVDRRRLASSDGCFTDDVDLTTHDVALNGFSGSWTQAWAPVFTTQLTVTAQLVDGFQSNPYRAVWLGRTAAQEHHPDHRFRYAAGLGARLWLEPLSSAVQAFVRAYRDNWDVQSITAELGYELVIDGAFRARARGRYYLQSGAAFFSDDYALAPAGQYFTGDRELSSMWSTMTGAQLSYTLTSGETNDLGSLKELRILLKGDWLHFHFEDFRYGRVRPPNNDAIVGTISLEALF